MELREPPRPAATISAGPAQRWLVAASLLALAALGALLWDRFGGSAGGGSDPDRLREVAGRLKTAGALDEAATLYERYLESGAAEGEAGASIAYSLGLTYLEAGRHEKALRWFYEAEARGAGELAPEVGKKIVRSLESLGRHHAARAALDSRSAPAPEAAVGGENDPVVARIGEEEIRRSEVERSLDELPPELAAQFQDPARRRQLLERYVADELLWRKAIKLEYDRDPQVLRRHATALKQLAVSKLVEKELLDRIEVDEADLRTYFEANKDRYRQGGEGGDGPEPTFEAARRAVEADYRRFKLEAGYAEMIETALSAEGVELFHERFLSDG